MKQMILLWRSNIHPALYFIAGQFLYPIFGYACYAEVIDVGAAIFIHLAKMTSNTAGPMR